MKTKIEIIFPFQMQTVTVKQNLKQIELFLTIPTFLLSK